MTRLKDSQIQDLIDHPYAWPGGYEKIGVASDGELICHRCIEENLENILEAYDGDGWDLVGIILSSELDPPCPCAHCSRELSPYLDD